ncbi:hypothetical protein [Mesorhizobium sp.]|uniref:hypothetical protein n=1 Tax=Mesorhizobium sp. TaxID=1871066 RepID=UPI00120776ED|nr:hypothetical protein [Mesorhizobium sp.]TIN21887.1 MAG: hypothetical protein E5Y19_34050 [Mesorhizobium sp.]
MRYNEQQIEPESSWIASCEPYLIGNRRNVRFPTSTGLTGLRQKSCLATPNRDVERSAAVRQNKSFGRLGRAISRYSGRSPKLIFAQRQQSTFAIVSQTSGLRIN